MVVDNGVPLDYGVCDKFLWFYIGVEFKSKEHVGFLEESSKEKGTNRKVKKKKELEEMGEMKIFDFYRS